MTESSYKLPDIIEGTILGPLGVTRLPHLAQHIILEFLDYRLRSGKYIRRLPKKLGIYTMVQERPIMEEFYLESDNPLVVSNYFDDDGEEFFCDGYGNDTYFRCSITTKIYDLGTKRKYFYENSIDLAYSLSDRGTFSVRHMRYDLHSSGWRYNSYNIRE